MRSRNTSFSTTDALEQNSNGHNLDDTSSKKKSVSVICVEEVLTVKAVFLAVFVPDKREDAAQEKYEEYDSAPINNGVAPNCNRKRKEHEDLKNKNCADDNRSKVFALGLNKKEICAELDISSNHLGFVRRNDGKADTRINNNIKKYIFPRTASLENTSVVGDANRPDETGIVTVEPISDTKEKRQKRRNKKAKDAHRPDETDCFAVEPISDTKEKKKPRRNKKAQEGECRLDETDSIIVKSISDTKEKRIKLGNMKGKESDKKVEDSMEKRSSCSDNKDGDGLAIANNDSRIQLGQRQHALNTNNENCMYTPYTFSIRTMCFILTLIITINHAVNVEGIRQCSPDPIVFGQNVTLHCIMPHQVDTSHLAWLKGEKGDVLAREFISSDPRKFETSMTKSGDNVVYHLTIMNFSESDVDGEYKCTFAFESLLFNLSVNEQHFVYIPTNHEVLTTVNLQGSILNVSVVINKVYPEPACIMLYQGKSFKSYWNTTVRRSLLFYAANMSFSVDVFDRRCGGLLLLKCIIGSQISLITLKDTNCEDSELKSTSILLPVIVTVVALAVVGIIVIGCFLVVCKSRCRRTKTAFVEQTTPQEVHSFFIVWKYCKHFLCTKLCKILMA